MYCKEPNAYWKLPSKKVLTCFKLDYHDDTHSSSSDANTSIAILLKDN